MKYFKSYKPYTRWWWFSNRIVKEDICYQLNWLKKNNFGGVEIAFVYPLENKPKGVKFLSKEWSDLVKFAKLYAKKIGLGCDVTFGSLWPFGGSFVSKEDSSRVYYGFSKQRIFFSWEHRNYSEGVRVLNHLSEKALKNYSNIIGNALIEVIKIDTTSLFCDSWEVETEGLWAEDFRKKFNKYFHYDILPYMYDLDKYPDIRYDYRKLISNYVLNFFKNFASICNRLKANSRVQCHGAPTNLVDAYSCVDIPESESILFDPEFSTFAASAALLSSKKITSCESFTCLYGWKPRPGPAPYIKQEIISDVKLLADALFANGVNQIIWHGMPFNTKDESNEFYASVYVGESGNLSNHFKYFNKYIEKVSKYMQTGITYSNIAVYLPFEDMLMKNKLPMKKRKPSAMYHWEMHYVKFPEELKGYHPMWISGEFLKKSKINNGKLIIGDAYFSLLYIFSEWIDLESLKIIYKLASEGLKVCIKKSFKEPGKIKSKDYKNIKKKLSNFSNVSNNLFDLKSLVEGLEISDFWCKKFNDEYLFFFANPYSKGLTYPIKYGFSLNTKESLCKVKLNIGGIEIPLCLKFGKNESIMVRINKNRKITFIKLPKWQDS